MYAIGPFDGRAINPARVGVYHVSPFKTGGGGYGYWDGEKWNRYANWGGGYWGNKFVPWYWFGLTEQQSKDRSFAR